MLEPRSPYNNLIISTRKSMQQRKTAIITGTSRGIGKAITLQLARERVTKKIMTFLCRYGFHPLTTSRSNLLTKLLTLLNVSFIILGTGKESLAIPQFSSQDYLITNTHSPTEQQLSVSKERGLSLPLSPGDRLRILIPGTGGEDFSGNYEVNLEGYLEIPFLEPQLVAGLTPKQAEIQLRKKLLERQFFQPQLLKVSIQILEWSSIHVTVVGETFTPGRVLINQKPPNRQGGEVEIALFPGDYPLERYLTVALLAAGGIKPTADIHQIKVIRGNESKIVDLSGIFSGEAIEDIPLISGDRIIVPHSGSIQNDLVRPSQITPTEIPLFISNITVPAQRSARLGSSTQDMLPFTYGIRFSQLVIAANCAGGTQSTNANRRAVLVQTDSLTGKNQTLDIPVEELLQSTSSKSNPFLMPNNSVVCYDSNVTNTIENFRAVSDLLLPFKTLSDILHRLF